MEIHMRPDTIDRDDEREKDAAQAEKAARLRAEDDDDSEWWMPLESELTGPSAAFHHRPGEERPPHAKGPARE